MYSQTSRLFGQHKHFYVISIIWSSVDHDSSRNSPNSSKVTNGWIRVSIGKVNWTLTRHNFHILHPFSPKKANVEENTIPYNFSFFLKIKRCTIWKIQAHTLQVIFRKSTKDTFCQDHLHQDTFFKCKIYQNRDWIRHLGLSKKS